MSFTDDDTENDSVDDAENDDTGNILWLRITRAGELSDDYNAGIDDTENDDTDIDELA